MRFAVTHNYTGRFAPSPTGPLHLGSLVAACASYLDARSVGGKWLVRMEDLDVPRNVPGADSDILRTLEQFGFVWDGPVVYQSTRTEVYEASLRRLRMLDRCFPCSCSRKDALTRYPGTCRNRLPSGAQPRSWRVRVTGEAVCFVDRLYGQYCQSLAEEVGDFVVKRADGQFAYQLAVVVDDAEQRVTDVVRGADLLDSTPRQIYLGRLLGYSEPRYLHVPVVVNDAGEKLSKQTRAAPVKGGDIQALRDALAFLGLNAPDLSASEMWPWAIGRWQQEGVAATQPRRPPQQ